MRLQTRAIKRLEIRVLDLAMSLVAETETMHQFLVDNFLIIIAIVPILEWLLMTLVHGRQYFYGNIKYVVAYYLIYSLCIVFIYIVDWSRVSFFVVGLSFCILVVSLLHPHRDNAV